MWWQLKSAVALGASAVAMSTLSTGLALGPEFRAADAAGDGHAVSSATVEFDYVTVGDAQVMKAVGVHTESELTDFLVSDTPKTVAFDPTTGRAVRVDLGNDDYGVSPEEALALWTGDATAEELGLDWLRNGS